MLTEWEIKKEKCAKIKKEKYAKKEREIYGCLYIYTCEGTKRTDPSSEGKSSQAYQKYSEYFLGKLGKGLQLS